MLRYELYENGESFAWKFRDEGSDKYLRLDGLASIDFYCVGNFTLINYYVHSSKTRLFIISEQNSIFFGQEYKQDII